MFKLYKLYLASSFVLPLMVSSIFFVGFLLTFQLFRFVQLMSSSDVSMGFIFSMIGELALTLVPMALPLSIFFSTIFCLNKISGDSEYIALRSFGVKKIKILAPFIIVSFIVAINLFFFTQQLVPNAHRNVRKKINIISSASLIQGIKSGQFFTSIPNVTLFPETMDENTKKLTNVFLQMYNPKKKEEKVIYAKAGQIIHEKDESTGFETFKLLLLDGNISTSTAEDQRVEKILFQEYSLPISSKKFSYTPSTREIMMSWNELNRFISDGLDKAIKNGFSKKIFFKARYEYWNRLNSSLLVILLTFLGFCLGVKATRSRGGNSSAKAILVIIAYYALFFSLVSLGRSDKIPMWLAVLAPSFALFGYSFKLYKDLDWQG